jgi:hypothetical protein
MRLFLRVLSSFFQARLFPEESEVRGMAMAEVEKQIRAVRALEGLGYVAAIMIGIAPLAPRGVTGSFICAGVMLGLIVVTRINAINAHLNAASAARLAGPPATGEKK